MFGAYAEASVRKHSPSGVDLSGSWHAHAAEPDLVRTFAAPELVSASWENVRVPHHWRAEPAFAHSDGPVLYRKQFRGATTASGRRAFLELDGILYYGDVWLDGEYLGATEGSFVKHAFEVSDALRARDEHVLAIEVACPPQRDRGAKRTITGPYWQSPLLDPELNPGGIWRPVRVVECGPVRIARARAVCVEASLEQGRVACHLTLDAGNRACEARLRAELRGPGGVPILAATRDATLATGTNELSWTLTVDDPPRWWPRALGSQPLCTLELTVDVDGEPSDARTFRTAFREVRSRDWQFFVNGERMFLKGACYGPTCALPGDADDSVVRGDVALAVDANLDFLRVHAHVAADALYDAADEVGLLLWQDFPMQGGYVRGVRKQAARQARAMVDLLGHRPSVFLWCAHDAPLGDDTPARLVVSAAAPTWGKEVLDRSVARAIARCDPTRPVLRHSGAGDDTHLWFGWLHGDVAGLAPAIRALPRLGRFVSMFGAQSVPHTTEWMHPEQWPDLDWDDLVAHHGMQRKAFAAHVPSDDVKSFDEWRDATQAYHAALLQLQIEDLRRCKGSPTGGFAVFAFADTAPTIGFGVLDHERVPKRPYLALRDACRPVLPMVDPRTGQVHVVNDGRVGLPGADVEVVVDGRARRWRGDIDADALAFVGRVELGDAIDVEAVLTHPSVGRVVNRLPLLILEAGRGRV
jgi:beta-mannosidase